MRHLHATSAATAVMIAALLSATPAFARPDSETAEPGPQTATGADDLTTGSLGMSLAEKRKKQFEDCMAIWEPATHMTKQQWQRTCRSSLEELPNL